MSVLTATKAVSVPYQGLVNQVLGNTAETWT